VNIQFLAFSDCPLAEPARENLTAAVNTFDNLTFDEIDILAPDCPESLRGWGSPTILINGADVTGEPKGASVCCRVYSTPSRVPEVQSIIDQINEASQAR